jgi:hypothetical protein
MLNGFSMHLGEKVLDWKMAGIISVVYTLILVTVFYIGKIDTEGFWDVSPAAQCRGGVYMHQGDSEQSKMCQALFDSPEGRCQVASYNCPVGYNGIPLNNFTYTPLSNDEWRNERCDATKTEGCPYVNSETLAGFTKWVDSNWPGEDK